VFPAVCNAASTNSVSSELSQILSRFTRNDTGYSHGDRTPVFMDWFYAVLIYVGYIHVYRRSVKFITVPFLD